MYETLRAMRKRKHLKQEDLAGVIGKATSNYCKKENGQVPFTVTEALLIADYLNTKVEKIFLLDDFQ